MICKISPDLFSKVELTERIKKGEAPPNAISWAAENGYTTLVRDLISLRADVLENDNYPLELASKKGYTEIVKILLEAGVSTQDSTDEGYCLRLAAYNGYTEIASMLIQSGANPVADNYLALKLALEKGNMEIVELLLDVISIERAERLRANS